MKYEYKVSSIEISDAPKSMADHERFLNKLGQVNWELISIVPASTKPKGRSIAFFKRPERGTLV